MLLPVARGMVSVFVVVPDAEAAQLHRRVRIDVRHVRLDVVLLHLVEVEVTGGAILLVQLAQTLRDVAHPQLRLPHTVGVPDRTARLLLHPLRDRALVHVRAVGVAAGRVVDVRHYLRHRRVRGHPEDLFGKHVA
uniref:Putative secreted peptide n=1 Tax=Anopheles braziliensis TaxID=58242 RepID=A0A2M3ZNW8_9DIPT